MKVSDVWGNLVPNILGPQTEKIRVSYITLQYDASSVSA